MIAIFGVLVVAAALFVGVEYVGPPNQRTFSPIAFPWLSLTTGIRYVYIRY